MYVLVRGKGMQERQLEQVKQVQVAQAEYIRSVAAGSSTGSSTGAADQIKSAKDLLDNGAITQAEFDQLKAKALI